jgi:hypothetical protein
LSPIDKENGPSYVQALYETGNIKNLTVSWQLADWGSEDNMFTVGGNVEGAYEGHLNFNLILADSPWTFNINY